MIELLLVAWAVVAQEWEPYRLNEQQRQWFSNARSKRPGPHCCDQADGHPTVEQIREDGHYIPDPNHPNGEWMKVPEEAFVEGVNPVGVPTVWFGPIGTDGLPYIRCFAPGQQS